MDGNWNVEHIGAEVADAASRTMEPFRVAATLTHLMPNLRATIAGNGRPMMHIATTPPKVTGASGCPSPTIDPEKFRKAVSGAYTRLQAGEAMSFLGLPPRHVPQISVHPAQCGKHLAGDIFRVPFEQRWCWLVGWAGDPVRACALAEERVATWDALPNGDHLKCKVDVETDVTVAYVETSAKSGSAHEMIIVRALEAILATWVVDEMMTAVGAAPASRASDRADDRPTPLNRPRRTNL